MAVAGFLYGGYYLKIHFNVMRFKETLNLDEAEVLAGRFKSVSARYYILHDPEKLAEKYNVAWQNFGINLNQIRIIIYLY